MVENVRHMLEQDTEAIKVWLKLLQAILREAMELKSDGDGFLLLEGTPLRAPGHYDIITRICQSLGLLAYNLNDAALREQVLAIVGSLPALDPRVTHSLYNRFAQVRTWVQLSAIVTSQALPTVRMWKRADDLGVSKYSLTYKTLKKEPSADKISDTKPARSTSSRKSAGLETRIVDQLTVETPQAVDLEFKRLCVALDGVTAAPAKRAISETAMAANALEGRLNDALSGPGLPDSHLLQALYRIQAFVRHAMRRRRKLPASAAAPLLSSNITACFQRCLALSFSTTERHQFLGPLPHVLTCLDLLQMHFEFEKDILSKKLMKVAHTELEEAGLQVLRAHTPLTKTLELQKCLQPLSELYLRDGWLLAFRSYVAEVGGLLREVKLDGAELGDLMAQWDIVQTSVLNIHRTRK
ncbi:hypothetical protein PsYK624_104380 [Phanerochaete sordida]|uniref:Uncharacterized protein n=1 Tax=Phanerochaete sordida TaxID=48140 RepID=A0A9P3LH31_9APHY|nr:hypothetical protein PsYK624_104380 [Phanerochaete sordida]